MPVWAEMPSQEFREAWMERYPDLPCVQHVCDLRVEMIMTASHRYGFQITHNGNVSYEYVRNNESEKNLAQDFVESVAKELGNARHKGDSEPKGPYVIER